MELKQLPPVESLPKEHPIRAWYDQVNAIEINSASALSKAKLLGPDILPYALEWTSSRNERLKAIALKILRAFDFQVDPESLVEAIKAQMTKIRSGSTTDTFFILLEGLKNHDTPAARHLLIELLDQPDDTLSAKAVQILASFNDTERLLEPLLLALTKKEQLVRQNRKKRLKLAAIWFALSAVINFLAFEVLKSLFSINNPPPIAIFFAASFNLITFNLLTSITSFQSNSIEALKGVKDIRAIGPLALAAQNKEVRAQAITLLEPLLDQITEDVPFSLPPEQMRALLQLLKGESETFTLKLVNALQFIGDETALERLQASAAAFKAFPLLTKKREAVLPVLKQRVERLREPRILLRPNQNAAHEQELLRAPLSEPLEPTQLLRSTPSEKA